MALEMARRKLTWCRQSNITAMLAAADGEIIDVLSTFRGSMGITANLPGTTVARVRMDLFCANAGNAVPIYAGLRKATFREIAEGGTDASFALASNPVNDALSDWMYWRAFYPNHGADQVTGLPNANTYEIDIKSMRKLDEPGETLGLFLGKGASTGGVSVFTTLSVLLALP